MRRERATRRHVEAHVEDERAGTRHDRARGLRRCHRWHARRRGNCSLEGRSRCWRRPQQPLGAHPHREDRDEARRSTTPASSGSCAASTSSIRSSMSGNPLASACHWYRSPGQKMTKVALDHDAERARGTRRRARGRPRVQGRLPISRLPRTSRISSPIRRGKARCRTASSSSTARAPKASRTKGTSRTAFPHSRWTRCAPGARTSRRKRFASYPRPSRRSTAMSRNGSSEDPRAPQRSLTLAAPAIAAFSPSTTPFV